MASRSITILKLLENSYTDSRLNKTITYEYDRNGNRMKMTDGEGGVTTYAYDSRNLLTSITNPAGKVFKFTYDAAGRRSGLNYPNGVSATYSYDSAGQITDIFNSLNGAPVTHNAYTYDPAGNRLTNTDTKGQHSYQYDSTYQLTQAINPTLTEAFTYDKNGNRVTETRGAETINYTNGAGNRIQSRNGVTYTHDKNGNIISKGDGANTTTYEYDYAGRLKKVTMPDGTTAEYKYDALWRRIEKKVTKGATANVTRYLYDGLDLLAEYDETNGIKAKYLHTIGIDDPLSMEKGGQSYYYHKDALGSVTAMTDAGGLIVQQYAYDAFGNIVHAQPPAFMQPFTFTGREYDEETGLYYYRMRTYDPILGKFQQEDPIGFGGGSINLFSYVGNNPVNYIDPRGLVTTVTIWQPVGWGTSSFGHVSTDINGTTYSFGPNGMLVEPTSKYVERPGNASRSGVGLQLSLTPEQEARLQACMNENQGSYSFPYNSCGTPVQKCLNELQVYFGMDIIPAGFGNDLMDSGLVNGYIFYNPTRPAIGSSAPWAR